MKTLTLYVQTRLFQLDSDICDDGLAMAHCFIRDDEYIILILRVNVIRKAPLRPKVWLTYVHESFILWQRQEAVQILRGHVYLIRPMI